MSKKVKAIGYVPLSKLKGKPLSTYQDATEAFLRARSQVETAKEALREAIKSATKIGARTEIDFVIEGERVKVFTVTREATISNLPHSLKDLTA